MYMADDLARTGADGLHDADLAYMLGEDGRERVDDQETT